MKYFKIEGPKMNISKFTWTKNIFNSRIYDIIFV